MRVLFLFSLLAISAAYSSNTCNKGKRSSQNVTIPVTCSGLDTCLEVKEPSFYERCSVLRVPSDKLPGPFEYDGYNVTLLRPHVYSFADGFYKSMLLYKNKHLIIVDFVKTGKSFAPDGTYRLNLATERVLGGETPDKVDMVYTHAHLDHIGGAALFKEWLESIFPGIPLRVWGNEETKDDVDSMVTVPNITNVVPPEGEAITVDHNLKLQMVIIGGHSHDDLGALVLKSQDGPGVLHFVDVVTPGAVPFVLFSSTTDLHKYMDSHDVMLSYDFEVFSGGHGLIGDRGDILTNKAYTEFVLNAASEAMAEVDAKKVAEVFAKWDDETAVEYRNNVYSTMTLYKLWGDICERKVIERWGCELVGADVLAQSHCETAIIYKNGHSE